MSSGPGGHRDRQPRRAPVCGRASVAQPQLPRAPPHLCGLLGTDSCSLGLQGWTRAGDGRDEQGGGGAGARGRRPALAAACPVRGPAPGRAGWPAPPPAAPPGPAGPSPEPLFRRCRLKQPWSPSDCGAAPIDEQRGGQGGAPAIAAFAAAGAAARPACTPWAHEACGGGVFAHCPNPLAASTVRHVIAAGYPGGEGTTPVVSSRTALHASAA